MTQESQAIEVEVVAIDGATPAVRNPGSAESGLPWQNWRGSTLKLRGYWWPLWGLLGAIVLVLLMALGLVFGTIYLIFRILRGIVRAAVR